MVKLTLTFEFWLHIEWNLAQWWRDCCLLSWAWSDLINNFPDNFTHARKGWYFYHEQNCIDSKLINKLYYKKDKNREKTLCMLENVPLIIDDCASLQIFTPGAWRLGDQETQSCVPWLFWSCKWNWTVANVTPSLFTVLEFFQVSDLLLLNVLTMQRKNWPH